MWQATKFQTLIVVCNASTVIQAILEKPWHVVDSSFTSLADVDLH